MHAGFYGEGYLGDEDVAVGGDDGHFVELDYVVGLDHGAFLDAVDIGDFASRALDFVYVDLWSDVFAVLEIIKDFLHFIDETGVACQLLDLFVGDNDSSDGFCEVDQ